MNIILKYFSDLTDQQIQQLTALEDLYRSWNSKINVISRKDIDHLYLHHVLHSMVISKWINFAKGTKILDVGSGGGFPGIPLAILYPEVDFHLVDSIRKKLKVVDEISEVLNLKNVHTTHSRVEDIKTKYDFVVCRAVADLKTLVSWTRKNISSKQINPIPNGLIALKGGDHRVGSKGSELKPLRKHEYIESNPIRDYFEEPFFKEKYIIYVQG